MLCNGRAPRGWRSCHAQGHACVTLVSRLLRVALVSRSGSHLCNAPGRTCVTLAPGRTCVTLAP
eukprot:8520417-Pyramimonas_sp.AAC.1